MSANSRKMSWRSPSLKSRLIGWPVRLFRPGSSVTGSNSTGPGARRRACGSGIAGPGTVRRRGRHGQAAALTQRRRPACGGGVRLRCAARPGAPGRGASPSPNTIFTPSAPRRCGRARALGEVEHQPGHAGESGAELGQPHLPHGSPVHLERAHGRAARDVLEVDDQAVRVAQEEVLVAQAAVGLDRDGERLVVVGLADRRGCARPGGAGGAVGAAAVAARWRGVLPTADPRRARRRRRHRLRRPAAGSGADAAAGAGRGSPAPWRGAPRGLGPRSNTRCSALSLE